MQGLIHQRLMNSEEPNDRHQSSQKSQKCSMQIEKNHLTQVLVWLVLVFLLFFQFFNCPSISTTIVSFSFRDHLCLSAIAAGGIWTLAALFISHYSNHYPILSMYIYMTNILFKKCLNFLIVWIRFYWSFALLTSGMGELILGGDFKTILNSTGNYIAALMRHCVIC